MVPKGWEVRNLKDVVSFLDGKRKPIKSEDRSEMKGIYPYYGATGIIDWVNDYIFDDELILMGEDGENILSRNLPHVFCITGKSWVNNHAHVMKVNSGIDSYYLATYLESLDYRKYNSGSAQPKLNKTICEKIPVIFPPLPEQQKIANILSTWDKAISTTERLIDNSSQQKKALMQQLLTGKKRLLDDEGKRFVGEWNKKTLAGICSKTISYGIVQTGEHVKDGVPCVRVVDLTQKTVSKNDMITTSDEINQSYNKTILESGEVMMALRGVVGLVRLVNEDLVGSNITRGLARLAPKNELIKSDFFLWILRSSYVKNELMRKVGGSALQEISLTALRKVQIPFPSLQEQQKIANVLTNADKEIELLEQQLANFQQEKKALMQVLLTGKKRVVV
jgi:type I restriction enzyme S subunit